jgi:nicotinamidase-related amidase
MTRSSQLLSRDHSCLLIVDVQERLLPTISGHQSLLRSVQLMVDAAQLLNVPVIVSEQYPKGLGPTVSDLRINHDSPEYHRFEKLRFSAVEGFRDWLSASAPSSHSESSGSLQTSGVRDVRQVVICGIESHVCVLQTALDLLNSDICVFVVEDAVGSFEQQTAESAVRRMSDSGATIVSAESVVFEWCETAAAAEFRTLSQLVRSFRNPS